MTCGLFLNYLKAMANGQISLVNNIIKCALLSDKYIPDYKNQVYWSDIVTDEVTGTNYTAGGVRLRNGSFTLDKVAGTCVFDADDVIWPVVTVSPAHAVLYRLVTTPADSPLIGHIGFGMVKSRKAQNFVLQWSASGIIKLSL